MTDMGDLVLRAQARAHDLNQTRAGYVVKRKTVQIPLAAYAATVDLTEAAQFVVPSHVTDGIKLVSMSITVSGAGVAGSDTLWRTLTLSKRDGAGGAATVVGGLVTTATLSKDADPGAGTFTTPASGTLSAAVPVAFTMSATASVLQMVVGGVLTLAIAHASTGTAITAGVLTLVYDEL